MSRKVDECKPLADGSRPPTAAAQQQFAVGDFWALDEEAVPYPWMEFVHPKNGQMYFYNFRDNIAAYCHPVVPARNRSFIYFYIKAKEI